MNIALPRGGGGTSSKTKEKVRDYLSKKFPHLNYSDLSVCVHGGSHLIVVDTPEGVDADTIRLKILKKFNNVPEVRANNN